MSRDWLCPKCSSPLSLSSEIDEHTGELKLTIWCEICDQFEGLTILTGLKAKDLEKFSKPRKRPVKKEMKII